MKRGEDQAYFIVKDTSQRTKQLVSRPGGFVHVNSLEDAMMDPLTFLDFPKTEMVLRKIRRK